MHGNSLGSTQTLLLPNFMNYPSTNSSLQISIFQIHQTFNISYFPQFNLSFEKKYLFPKTPKNHPKIYTKLPNSGQCNKHRDLASLET